MTSPDDDDLFSVVADQQLGEIEDTADSTLLEAVYDACDLIAQLPHEAQNRSAAIITSEGVRLVLPVVGHSTKVHWSSGPPVRIEALFPVPPSKAKR